MRCVFPTEQRVRPRRAGFTLIEVVVGLVLMATLLVGLVLATTVHKRSLKRASDKLAAVAEADALLVDLTRQRAEWWPAAGPVADRPAWQWSTRAVVAARPLGVPVQTVRLTIVDTASQPPVELVAVDVVAPQRGPR